MIHLAFQTATAGNYIKPECVTITNPNPDYEGCSCGGGQGSWDVEKMEESTVQRARSVAAGASHWEAGIQGDRATKTHGWDTRYNLTDGNKLGSSFDRPGGGFVEHWRKTV